MGFAALLSKLFGKKSKAFVEKSEVRLDVKKPLPIDRSSYPHYPVCWYSRVENDGRVLEAESIDVAQNGVGLWVRKGTSATGDSRVSFLIPHGHGKASGKKVVAFARAVRALGLPEGGMLWGLAFIQFETGKEALEEALSLLC